MWRHFKSNLKIQHENQIWIIHFFLCRSEKKTLKANIYPILWVVARPAWLTLNKTQALFRAMTTENVALWLKMYKYINKSIKAAKHTGLELLVSGLSWSRPKEISCLCISSNTSPLQPQTIYQNSSGVKPLQQASPRLNQQSTSITISEYNSCVRVHFSGGRNWLGFFLNQRQPFFLDMLNPQHALFCITEAYTAGLRKCLNHIEDGLRASLSERGQEAYYM